MDYLDNELDPPEETIDERTPKRHYAWRLYWGVAASSVMIAGVKILIARNDTVRKVSIGKGFYKYWFPYILLGALIHPVDRFLWDHLDSQIEFWQNSIFTLKNIDAVNR